MYIYFFLISIPKALHQHISKVTYCSLNVYYHIFTMSFHSFPGVFTTYFTGVWSLGLPLGFDAVFHFQRGQRGLVTMTVR